MFTATTVNAQLISYPPQKIMGFRGLDSNSSAPLIPDSRASDLQNVRLSSALDLRQRYGYDTVNNQTLDDLDIDSPAITGIFDAEYSDGTSWTLAFVGSKLKYDNSGVWTQVTDTGITSGKNGQWECIMALDSAVCTNDVDVPLKINSTPTASALDVSDLSDTLTKAKTSLWFRNYLIFMNTVENAVERPTRFRWSDVGTIETYQDDNFNDIATFAGDEIIGASEMYGDIYIFLTKSIWKASLVGGDEIFIFKKIIDGIGAAARDSIQTVQLPNNRSVTMFLDDRKKVYMFDGVSVVNIGHIIQPTLDGMSSARLQYAVSTFDGDDYILCVTKSASSENDLCFDYQIEVLEWTKFDGIVANAMAQVEESASLIKSYFGDYDSMVFWLDNPDLKNDVAGASGIVDSVGIVDTGTITGAQILIDATVETEVYTGATVKITSGTGAGQSAVISAYTSTGIVLTQPMTTSPDSTSVYSVGAIDAYYNGKHYELGDAAMEKTQFLGMLMWGEEASGNAVDVAYAIDFGSNIESETVSLAPSGSSLWDVALWDSGTWGTTGDKIYTVKFSGLGNHIQPKFSNNKVDETFHLYGYNIIATGGDIKQP